MATIGLLGGSFDPPHIGHLAGAKWVLRQSGIDQVWLLPAFRHGFGKNLTPFKDRVEMTRLLLKGVSGAEVSDAESKAPGSGRTVEMLEYLVEKYPQHQFRFAVGTDILADLHKWKNPERVKELAPFLVIPRAGYAQSELPEISSSQVRAALASGKDVSEWLTPEVEAYIRQHKLYGASVRERMEHLLASLTG
jgi:nicotinate-nucleotide adenylyltransferase